MALPLPAYGTQLDINFDGVLVDVIVTRTDYGSPFTRTSQTVFEWRKLTEQQQSRFIRLVNHYGGTIPFAAPVAGNETILLSTLPGSPKAANATGYQSGSTRKLYATLYVDDVKYMYAIPERRVTTYTDLLSILNAKLSGIATVSIDDNSNLVITSATAGGGSSVKIVRDGDNNIFRNLSQFVKWGKRLPGANNITQAMKLNNLTFQTLRVPIRERLFDMARTDIINRIATSDLPFLSFLLDDTGNEDANRNFTAVGSPALGTTTFRLAPTSGQFVVVNSLNIHYSDSGSFRYDGFGSEALPVTNGVTIRGVINGRIYDFTNGYPVRQNSDWQHIASNILLNSWANPGDTMIAQMNIESFGRPLMLNGNTNDELQVIVSDDFSFLDDFHFVAHGFQ